MTTRLSKFVQFAFLLGLAVCASALQLCAAPGDLDPSFDPGSGLAVNPIANIMVVQPDGRIIIAGGFTTVRGLVRSRLARLNADGSGDPTFNAGPISVGSVAVQHDGKVLIAGNFTEINGFASRGIARLNSDGSVDKTFKAADELSGAVQHLVVQPDGKVLVTGSFGDASPDLARLNSDGTVDSNSVPPTDLVASGVNVMALQSDGKVLMSVSGPDNFKQIVRLNSDGSLDESFSADAEGEVSRLVLQPDGKVLVGGSLARVNGIARNHIARLYRDGTLDETFDNPDFITGSVQFIAAQTDGKALVAGSFRRVQDGEAVRIVRLNEDGTLDASFHPKFEDRLPNSGLSSMAMQPDGSIVVSGFFHTVDGINRSRMARLTSNGSLDTSFNAYSGVDQRVLGVRTQADGKVLIGGSFAGVQGLIRPGIARLNAKGTIDPTFNSSLIPYPADPADPREVNVWGLLDQPDGRILVEYNAWPAGDTASATFNLARVNGDGSVDVSFSRVEGPTEAFRFVGALALQSNGQVLVGGYFTALNGVARNGLARLNENGTLDLSFDVQLAKPTALLTPAIRSIVVQPDGKLLIAGRFAAVNGTANAHVARLNGDGTVDASFHPGTGVEGAGVASLLLQPDGKVLIGGSITNVNGVSRNGIARLNADGTLDASFDSGAGASQVYLMAFQPDGKVVIGLVATESGVPSWGGLARLNSDGRLDGSFKVSPDMVEFISSFDLQPNGGLLIGGFFPVVNGIPRNYVARVFWSDAAILVSAPSKQGGDLIARFKGTPGFTYTIESCASLSSAPWQKLGNQTAPTNDLSSGVGVFEMRDQIGPENHRFYRTIYPAY